MKTARLVTFIVIPLLFACAPKKPEMPLAAVPAEPLLQALEQHRRSFSGLKAVASVEVSKGLGKRSFDTVGVVVDDQRRFRIEAYGPLGESLAAIVWDGQDVLVRPQGEEKAVRRDTARLQRVLGKGVSPGELCAVLSGNLPETDWSHATLRCGQDGGCILELRQGKLLRRFRTAAPAAGEDQEPRIMSYELFRSDKLIFEGRFDRFEEIDQYRLPMRVVIDNPARNLRVSILYTEAEVNIPISAEAFSLTDEAVNGK